MGIESLFGYYKVVLDNAFSYYNSYSRAMLDYLYLFFHGIFNFLLIITVFISLIYLIMSIYSVLPKRKNAEEEFIEENAPHVTIQIPTLNETAAIRCAESCLGMDYPKDRYEIIIGDDSTNPEISRKIDEFAKSNPKIIISRRGSNTGYKSGNLNYMLNISKGEFIVVFDSDFIPPKDFLKRIIAPMIHDKNIAAVQARWKFTNHHQNLVSELGAVILSVYHYITLPFIYNMRKISFLCGSAEAVRKSTLIKLGGWESGNLTEDIEYSMRLIKNGYSVGYIEGLECEGEVPHKARDLYKQQMRWAYGVISSYKSHWKDLILNKKISFEDKLYLHIVCSGYLFAVLLAGLTVTGTLSMITHAPAPIDFGRLFSEIGVNILLTSGLIIASIIALVKSRKTSSVLKAITSSFSYGLVVTYYVNVGIIKAIVKRPMQWFMLDKNSNRMEL